MFCFLVCAIVLFARVVDSCVCFVCVVALLGCLRVNLFVVFAWSVRVFVCLVVCCVFACVHACVFACVFAVCACLLACLRLCFVCYFVCLLWIVARPSDLFVRFWVCLRICLFVCIVCLLLCLCVCVVYFC